MGKLSTPEQMEVEESEGTDANEGGSVQPPEPKLPEVEFAEDGKVPLVDAVESLSLITSHPEAFELSTTQEVSALRDENRALREELRKLRSDVAVLWSVLSTEAVDGRRFVQTSDGDKYVPDSVDSENPLSVVGDHDG
jgi:hypothetical protein